MSERTAGISNPGPRVGTMALDPLCEAVRDGRMNLVGFATSLLALAASFRSRPWGDVKTDRALENVLGISQLRAASILGVPSLPMEAGSVATLATNGRTIFYNPAFLRSAIAMVCSEAPCVEGLVLAMVAHELAHAYCHANAMPGHKIELEADEVAGYVLGRVGMSARDFVTVLRTFRETRLHPSADSRAERVRRGYARGVAEAARPKGGHGLK